MKKTGKEVYIWLQDIRSVYNVGSIFRTADAAGVSKIFLVGVTPAPVDRFGRVRKDLAKVALGAEKNVGWEVRKSAPALLRELKKKGFQIIALEQSPKSIHYRKIKLKNRVCIVLGEETKGLTKEFLKKVNVIAEIPMRGKKESLNVSVSAGIALFGILNI